jgi:hypothetical protein
MKSVGSWEAVRRPYVGSQTLERAQSSGMPRGDGVVGLRRLERYVRFWDCSRQAMPITPHTKIEDLPQFLTVEEWLTFIRIGRSSAYELIRQGLVPGIRWGRTVMTTL